MIRFFKAPQPATLFIIPIVVLVLWAQAFFIHPFITSGEGGPLYNLLTGVISTLPGFLQVLIAIGFISLEAIYFNNIMNRQDVLEKNSYLPALMYALLMSIAFPVLRFHPVIFVNLFLLRAIDKIFMLFKNETPISPLFDSCFLISIAALFYPPATTLFIFFIVALAILRPFIFREWVISSIGFFLPFFFLSVWFFWTDQLASGWKNILQSLVPQHSGFGFMFEKPLASLLVLLGLLLLISLRSMIKKFNKNTVRTRSYQQIMLLFFLIAGAASILLKIIQLYHFALLAIPLSVFFAHYFLGVKKRPWFAELILWLMIGLIVWNHF